MEHQSLKECCKLVELLCVTLQEAMTAGMNQRCPSQPFLMPIACVWDKTHLIICS